MTHIWGVSFTPVECCSHSKVIHVLPSLTMPHATCASISNSPKVFDGTCWLSDESEGVFYDTNCYANFDFSRSPILNIHPHPFDIDVIILDRHVGLVGVLISGAGKGVKNIRN